MSTADRLGNPLTIADPATAQRYDEAVDALLHFSDEVVGAWEATVRDEPSFAMGHIGRAQLRTLSSEEPSSAEARRILDPLGDGEGLTDRERRHLEAARAYAAGDLYGASEQLSALSVEYPTDALALVLGHQLDFFCADALTLRDRIGRALSAWDPDDEWYGFVLGMQSFGLEECGLYPQAETAGREALDRNPRDVWALHAVVHVHEMQGRVDEGLRLMDERRSQWTEGNFFVVHNSWHEALFRLEIDDIAGALEIYDTILQGPDTGNVALELLDAAGLLWRLHLDEVDVGDRWAPLADRWQATLGEPWYVFNDMHAAMAFVGAGRLGDAHTLVHRLESFVEQPPAGELTNVVMTAEVGLPICSAVVAFGEERYGDAVDLLLPIRTIVHRFGGSHAQRDVVARTLFEAAIRDGNLSLARAIASERLAVRSSSTYTRRQVDRIGALT